MKRARVKVKVRVRVRLVTSLRVRAPVARGTVTRRAGHDTVGGMHGGHETIM